jgi:hypothetical protein
MAATCKNFLISSITKYESHTVSSMFTHLLVSWIFHYFSDGCIVLTYRAMDLSLYSLFTTHKQGQGFRILDKKRFEEEVLPRHFGQKSKFASFTRKLNRW